MGPIVIKPILQILIRSTHLIRGQQRKVVRGIRNYVSLATRITARTSVPEAVQADAEHSVGLESGHEQVPVLAALTELRQRAIVQGNLSHATSARGRVN